MMQIKIIDMLGVSKFNRSTIRFVEFTINLCRVYISLQIEWLIVRSGSTGIPRRIPNHRISYPTLQFHLKASILPCATLVFHPILFIF